VFDPATITDETCAEGHLDTDPVYQVLLALGQKQVTGRLTIADGAGDNHMYFMAGRPVGVQLAEHFHPLGQLLLELGRINGATFVKAQRLIAEGGRLPGQVYKELGVLDDAGLKEVLGIQARRKAEHFCRLGSRPFSFCRGLTFLTGFTSTPLDAHAVTFLAVRQQMGEQAREAWLESARGDQVQLVPPGMPPFDHAGLPAPLAQYGFSAPEERFLQRLVGGFESVVELADTGTLPRDEMAVLLRYLEVIGRLRRRPIPPPAPAAVPPPLFSMPTTLPQPPASVSSPFSMPTTAPLPMSTSTPPAPAVPAHISALVEKPPELAALQNAPLKEPTSDDVFSRPLPAAPGPVVPPPAAFTPPPRPPAPRPVPAPVSAVIPPVIAPLPDEEPLFAGPSDATDPRRPAVRAEPRAEPQVQSIVVSEDLSAPVVKKKKVRRTEALPSETSGVLVSETRREKTELHQLPSIVIEDD
jgi:hypothetical protein